MHCLDTRCGVSVSIFLDLLDNVEFGDSDLGQIYILQALVFRD